MENLIDFNHHLGAEIGEKLLSNAQELAYLQIINNLNPKFGKDGDQYYYIIGELPESSCIVGFGNTPRLAMIEFCKVFYNGQ